MLTWTTSLRPTGRTGTPRHIAERCGLMTIILLGESIFPATIAVRTATAEVGLTPVIIELVAGGLFTVFSMWSYYFYRPVEPLLTDPSLPQAFAWGSGHSFLFAAGAAVGAGLAVAVDRLRGHAILLTGVILATLLAWKLVGRHRAAIA